MGIEPMVSSLPMRCFTTKLPRHGFYQLSYTGKIGANGRSRTDYEAFARPAYKAGALPFSHVGKYWSAMPELNRLNSGLEAQRKAKFC